MTNSNRTKLNVTREGLRVRVSTNDDGFIESQSVEANLLYILLERLEEVCDGLVDIEGGVEKIEREIKI